MRSESWFVNNLHFKLLSNDVKTTTTLKHGFNTKRGFDNNAINKNNYLNRFKHQQKTMKNMLMNTETQSKGYLKESYKNVATSG